MLKIEANGVNRLPYQILSILSLLILLVLNYVVTYALYNIWDFPYEAEKYGALIIYGLIISSV